MKIGCRITISVIFAKMYENSNNVIPAKAGIQYYQLFSGFRVKPGMTNRGDFATLF
jgi:hypothetical protein